MVAVIDFDIMKGGTVPLGPELVDQLGSGFGLDDIDEGQLKAGAPNRQSSSDVGPDRHQLPGVAPGA